jgi:hypothetical protein
MDRPATETTTTPRSRPEHEWTRASQPLVLPPAAIDFFNHGSRQNFDAEFLKSSDGFLGQGFDEGWKNRVAASSRTIEVFAGSMRGIRQCL